VTGGAGGREERCERRQNVRVVIMGCGRVGSSLAAGLERQGHEVAVVDRDPGAFRRLSSDFRGEQVCGMGFHRDVLARAGADRAAAFAAVSNGDNSNIIAARVAREKFGIERVVARIYDARRAEVYERLGIPTVASVPWTTDRLMRMILPEGVASAWRDPSGKVAVLALPVHEGWAGRAVSELEQQTGCRVAFMLRFGAGLLPNEDTVVQADDTIYVAAVSGSIGEVTAAAAREPERS
jgi:trk system potassium uptake protein TrkA